MQWVPTVFRNAAVPHFLWMNLRIVYACSEIYLDARVSSMGTERRPSVLSVARGFVLSLRSVPISSSGTTIASTIRTGRRIVVGGISLLSFVKDRQTSTKFKL